MSTVQEQEFFEHHALNTQVKTDDVFDQRANDFLRYLDGVSNVHCKYCKGKNITCRLLQTRSVDEGMSAFYICNDCKKRWHSR